MNNKPKLYSIISGAVLMVGLLMLFVAALTVETKDVFATNNHTLEAQVIKTWQGFSYNYISAGNLALFNIGLVLAIVGCASFIFFNLWLIKPLSRHQINATFGKKINAMYIILALIGVGLLVSFLAGGSWDEMMDPSSSGNGLPTTVHRYIAMGTFGAGFVITLIHVSFLISIKDVKGKITFSLGKGV